MTITLYYNLIDYDYNYKKKKNLKSLKYFTTHNHKQHTEIL